MKGLQRQREILQILQRQDAPISASQLARRFQVSRQVIVQDIALLRARNHPILATYRGYAIPSDSPQRSMNPMNVSQLQQEILRLKQLTGLISLFKDVKFGTAWKPAEDCEDPDNKA